MVKVSETYRRRHKAETLLATLERRHSYYDLKHRDKLQLSHLLRLVEARNNLIAYLNEKPDPAEINSSLSSRAMIKQPVKDTIHEVFKGMPIPTKRNYTDHEQTLVITMKETGRTQAAAIHKTTLMYEIAWRAHNNHFMVFNTLTVEPKHYAEIFRKNSTHFKTYIEKFRNTLPERARETHAYFAVVEEGGQTGRLHIHVMHFMAELPKGTQDPNKHRNRPTHREIESVRHLWTEYGYCTPIMVRYSPNDAWGRLHYRWPLDPKTQKPYKIRSPMALATYMSKYITKSYNSKHRSKLAWRVRKSHSLGRTIPTELLSKMKPQDLLNIATNDAIQTKLNNRKIPPAILRLTALRLYNHQSHTPNHKHSLPELAKGLISRPNPLHSTRDLIRSTLECSQQNIGATRITDTDAEASFSLTIQRLKIYSRTTNDKYFRTATAYGATSISDYVYPQNATGAASLDRQGAA